MNPSEKVKHLADDYIAQCWPAGCPPMQAIEIKLAFYAGMAAMYSHMLSITERHGDNDTASAAEVGATVSSIATRALRLNQERIGLRP